MCIIDNDISCDFDEGRPARAAAAAPVAATSRSTLSEFELKEVAPPDEEVSKSCASAHAASLFAGTGKRIKGSSGPLAPSEAGGCSATESIQFFRECSCACGSSSTRMKVVVKNIARNVFEIELEASSTVRDVKNRLNEQHGIGSPELMKLIFQGNVLGDDDTLNGAVNYSEDKFMVVMVSKYPVVPLPVMAAKTCFLV